MTGINGHVESIIFGNEVVDADVTDIINLELLHFS